MKKIGITGCIGSGKSTVCRIFETLGVPVYNADLRAKYLMIHSPELVAQIKTIFGEDAYFSNGSLNTKFISSKAFSDRSLIEKLDAAVHPFVFLDFDEWCKKFSDQQYIVKEAALIFESGSYKLLDEVIAVTAPEELRIERTISRDKISKEAVLGRMENQFTQEEKIARSQYEIKNNEEDLLIPQVLRLHKKFTS